MTTTNRLNNPDTPQSHYPAQSPGTTCTGCGTTLDALGLPTPLDGTTGYLPASHGPRVALHMPDSETLDAILTEALAPCAGGDPAPTVLRDGDSYFEWGEPWDGGPRHVVVMVPSVHAVEVLQSLALAGVLVDATDDRDWSVAVPWGESALPGWTTVYKPGLDEPGALREKAR